MPALASRPDSRIGHTVSDIQRPRDPVFATVDDLRAREAELIAPDARGAVLMHWLTTPGTTGRIRAQEILDLFAAEKHNGVIWTVHHYLKNHPTGDGRVDHMGHWEFLGALGIDVGVDSIKAFLKHVVMNASVHSKGESPNG